MRISRIILHNYRQHSDLDIKITGNLIGVVGPNGKGKSNFLGAIQYALTGEVPGVTKDKLLMWGDKIEAGFAELYFEHQGTEIVVHRGVGNETTWVKVGKEKKQTGITKVNAILTDLIGIDKDIGRMVFVQQKMLDQVLFDLPSKREVAFQRMCGIGDAGRIHKDVGNFLTMRMGDLPDYTAQIAECHAQMASAQEAIKTAEAEKAAAQAQAPTTKLEDIEQQLNLLQLVIQNIDTILHTTAAIEHYKQNIAGCVTSIAALQSAGADIPEDRVNKRIDDMRNLVNGISAYLYAVIAVNKAKAASAALGKCAVDETTLATMKQAADNVRVAYYEASGRINLYKDLDKALRGRSGDLTACPVCGSPITDPQALVSHLQELIVKAQQEADKYNPDAKDQAYQKANNVLAQHVRNEQSVTQSLREAEARLQAVEAVPGTQEELQLDLQAKQVELQQMITIRDDLATQRANLLHTQGVMVTNQQQMEQSITQRDAMLVSIRKFEPGIQLDESDAAAMTTTKAGYSLRIEALEQGKRAWQMFAVEVAGIDGRVRELNDQIRRLQVTLKSLEDRRSQDDLFRDVRGTLINVREFYHYNNGPHKLAVSILNEMNHDVNTFLQKLWPHIL